MFFNARRTPIAPSSFIRAHVHRRRIIASRESRRAPVATAPLTRFFEGFRPCSHIFRLCASPRRATGRGNRRSVYFSPVARANVRAKTPRSESFGVDGQRRVSANLGQADSVDENRGRVPYRSGVSYRQAGFPSAVCLDVIDFADVQ